MIACFHSVAVAMTFKMRIIRTLIGDFKTIGKVSKNLPILQIFLLTIDY